MLGAIAQATETTRHRHRVTCPTIRIHPAIVAQAAATTAAMLPGRFFLGVGTGENLNEHVLGAALAADRDVRREMLEEAVEVIRLLWQRRAQQPPWPPLHRRERADLHAPGRAAVDRVAAAADRRRRSSPAGSATG